MNFALLLIALAVESPLVSVDHGDHKDHGAGVAVSSSVLVTNAHVVGTNKLVTVNGRPGRVLAVDTVWDLAAFVDRAKQSPGPAPTFADPSTRPAKQDSPQPTTTKVKVCGPNGCREIDVPKAAPVWQWRPMRWFRR